MTDKAILLANNAHRKLREAQRVREKFQELYGGFLVLVEVGSDTWEIIGYGRSYEDAERMAFEVDPFWMNKTFTKTPVGFASSSMKLVDDK